MKLLLSLASAALIALGSPVLDKIKQLPLGEGFLAWAEEHGKQYDSEEVMVRFGTWKGNRQLIIEHNKLAEAGKKSFIMALNQFGDLTTEEYRKTVLGKARLAPRRSSAVGTFRRSDKYGAAPDEWDWRPLGIVNAVKDQGQCGSCWSFSAVAAMEGAFNHMANGTVPSVCTTTCGPNNTPCCSFSEQELVDCVLNGADNCNAGGEMHDGVMEIVTNQKGKMNTEEQYPYTSGGGTSPGVCHAKPDVAMPTSITGYANVTVGDEVALKQASYGQTIISIAIDASQNTFQFYSSGVYDEPACKTKAVDLDHGVAIVGYGIYSGPAPGPTPGPGPAPGPGDCTANTDEASCKAEAGCNWCIDPIFGGGFCFSYPCSRAKEERLAYGDLKLPAANGTDYWLVRNSWGSSWGAEGYIMMSRNKNNQCGVASDAIYAVIG